MIKQQKEMTIEPGKKHCYACKRDLDATIEHFYPSYLIDSGRNICRECHGGGKRVHEATAYSVLKERAIKVEQGPDYKSLSSIATTLGWKIGTVEKKVQEQGLPIYTYMYRNIGPALALAIGDAENFIQANLNGTSPILREKPPRAPKPMGSPDICGCCGAKRGNILAVLDKKKNIRAYLCSPCFRTAESYKWEPERMRNMARMIEKIGIENFVV